VSWKVILALGGSESSRFSVVSFKFKRKRRAYAEFAEKRKGKRDFSLRGPTRQNAAQKKKSGRSVRNDALVSMAIGWRSRNRRGLRRRGGGGGLGFVEVHGIVLDAAVVGGEEFEGFLGDDGGFAVGAGKAVDGLEGGPQGLYDEANDDAIGLCDDAGLAEAVEGAEVRKDVFAEVAQVIGEPYGGGACGPEANNHVRRLLK
jgi:hypothetical protein